MARRPHRRRDRPSRLMLVLALSVGVPGLILSWLALRAVQTEVMAEQADFQQRCEAIAGLLYAEVQVSFEALEQQVGQRIDRAGQSWSTDPGAAVRRVRRQLDALQGVLILDGGGDLVYPLRRERGASEDLHLLGHEDDLIAVMGRPFQEAMAAELQRGDAALAAALYFEALPSIPGYRGQLIARNARARCLLKAGRPAEALSLYIDLVDDAASQRDLNGFPLDLLARYQTARCQRALGMDRDAALTLHGLLLRLSQEAWSYGGVAESAIADQLIADLADPALRRLLPDDDPVDLDGARRTFDRRRQQQVLESRVLTLIPAIAASSGASTGQTGRFVYQRLEQGDLPFLFARTAWTGRGERRTLVLHLDEDALLAGMLQRLDGIQQANPELTIELGEVTVGPAPLSSPPEGVVYQLEPWLPGRTVIVGRGDPTTVSEMLQRGRRLRLATILAFSVLIVVGLIIAYRTVNREFEIARMRTDFVSNVSHELRTPLATIRISAEMLSLGMVPGQQRRQEYYETILSESERLSRLIDNVLDFARIEQGRKKYRFREGNISELLEEAERVLQDYIASAGFAVELDVEPDLPRLRFDRDALVQALINLVTNAVRYTSSKDPARRRVTLAAWHEYDHVVLSVEDRGDGMDARDQKRAFEKFHRGGDHLTRTVRGAGLGLSIVRHIVEAHGGRVRLRSEKGVGTTFYLDLPVEIDVD